MSPSSTDETWLEKWLLHEANEVYNYYSCLQQEPNPRIKEIWERCCDYELGHLHTVMELFKSIERRDPAEVLPQELPERIDYSSQRAFVREVLNNEVKLRAVDGRFIDSAQEQESQATIQYREQLNAEGSPSATVAAGYRWTPGTEMTQRKEPAVSA
jgi:hypothetical protein